MTIHFKGTPIECCFSYFHNKECSLVVDIIRYHRRIVSRIFYRESQPQPLDYSRYCTFPTGNQPFEARGDGNYLATMDINNRTIHGNLVNYNNNPPLEFNIVYNAPQNPYCLTDPYDYFLSRGLLELPHRPSLSNRLAHIFISALDAGLLEEITPIRQEDYPVVTVLSANINNQPLTNLKGAISHHWGWAFPDYIFLMCNDFDVPNVALSLCICRGYTPLGIEATITYLYLIRPNHPPLELSINNLSTMMYYFEGRNSSNSVGAPHYLTILAWPPQNPKEKIKVQINYYGRPNIPHIMGTQCWTYLDVGVRVEYGGQTFTGQRAILDVKGKYFELI